MKHIFLWAGTIISVLNLAVTWAADGQVETGASPLVEQVGPRGPVGPDVPLSADEKRQFSKRIVVQDHTAGAVQAACRRASESGLQVVFLPAGDYVFDRPVTVPGGLTLVGEGSKTSVRAGNRRVDLFVVKGDHVRFTRLKLQGADTTTSAKNDTFGIIASKVQNVRVDHCELLGFSYATYFANEATAQVDHCVIHHNLRDGLGYGVAIYSGAYVLITDNEFYQNRHSLASNGALDWSSPKRVGKYVHKPGFRKTHWEFVHNRVGSNDKSTYELCAVDTHPGMDGTFVVEYNLFENLRHGVGIRDGSGLIRRNVFRNLRARTRKAYAITISYDTHNGIPVEGCMPNNILVEANVFLPEGAKYQRYRIGKAENIFLDGQLVQSTKSQRPAKIEMPRLEPMGTNGRLRLSTRTWKP